MGTDTCFGFKEIQRAMAGAIAATRVGWAELIEKAKPKEAPPEAYAAATQTMNVTATGSMTIMVSEKTMADAVGRYLEGMQRREAGGAGWAKKIPMGIGGGSEY